MMRDVQRQASKEASIAPPIEEGDDAISGPVEDDHAIDRPIEEEDDDGEIGRPVEDFVTIEGVRKNVTKAKKSRFKKRRTRKAKKKVVKEESELVSPHDAPSAGFEKPPSRGKRFKEQFRLFAMLGDTRNSGSSITHENSVRWLKQANIIDNRIVTIHDAEIHFINELKRQRSLTILEYINFVKALSSEKGIEASLVIHRLIECGLPENNSSSIDAEKRQSEPTGHTLPLYLTKMAVDAAQTRSSTHLMESRSLLSIRSSRTDVEQQSDIHQDTARKTFSVKSKRSVISVHEKTFSVKSKRSVISVHQKTFSVKSKRSLASVHEKRNFLPPARLVSLHLAKCFESVRQLEQKKPAVAWKSAVAEKSAVAGKSADAGNSVVAGKYVVAEKSAAAGKSAVAQKSADAGKSAVAEKSAVAGKSADAEKSVVSGKSAVAGKSAATGKSTVAVKSAVAPLMKNIKAKVPGHIVGGKNSVKKLAFDLKQSEKSADSEKDVRHQRTNPYERPPAVQSQMKARGASGMMPTAKVPSTASVQRVTRNADEADIKSYALSTISSQIKCAAAAAKIRDREKNSKSEVVTKTGWNTSNGSKNSNSRKKMDSGGNTNRKISKKLPRGSKMIISTAARFSRNLVSSEAEIPEKQQESMDASRETKLSVMTVAPDDEYHQFTAEDDEMLTYETDSPFLGNVSFSRGDDFEAAAVPSITTDHKMEASDSPMPVEAVMDMDMGVRSSASQESDASHPEASKDVDHSKDDGTAELRVKEFLLEKKLLKRAHRRQFKKWRDPQTLVQAIAASSTSEDSS